MKQGQLRVGTSGWMYKHWKGIFYPPGMAGDKLLPFYAERFDTVEINNSFYRLPGRDVFEKWAQLTPSGFEFAVKGSRYLTHRKKLKDPDEPLSRLTRAASGLGDKLGPILLQFQGNWGLDLPRLEGFVEALRPYDRYRFAFEFRHKSWLEPRVYALLESVGAALVLPVHPKMPIDVRLTSPWTYVRMHAGRYSGNFADTELRDWSDCIRAWRGDGSDVYVYFNNDQEGFAFKNARRLLDMLSERASKTKQNGL